MKAFSFLIFLLLLANPLQALEKGDLAPDFAGREYGSAAAFQLNQTFEFEKPKALVLSFFQTTCLPCIREAPLLQRLAKEYEAKKIPFYYVNLDSTLNESRLESFLSRLKVTMPMVIVDPRLVADSYQAYAFPRLVILDGQRRVLGIIEGYHPNLEEEIQSILMGLED